MDLYLLEWGEFVNGISDVKGFETFAKIQPVNKGWSGDKKYYIETADGRKLLLRVADISQYARKKSEYELVSQFFALDIPIPEPLDFGLCDNDSKVYSLFTFCDGEDAEIVLPRITEAEQYAIGIESGKILKKLHTIPVPKNQEHWADRFNRKINTKIEKYRGCGLSFKGDNQVMEYIETNRNLLDNRPQFYQHGDYHAGNMVISPDGKLSIIDFNRFDFGDPWEEFNRIAWSAVVSPHFATGQINGYFGGRPPMEFFKLLALYIFSNTVSSIPWAIPFGQEEIDTMIRQSQNVLAWFDNMENPVPSWYMEDFYIQYMDGIPYKLKKAFDMSFISSYGTVFKVFDDQDSGNICFGLRNQGKRYFAKFAGAPTERACCSAEQAVQNLKSAVPVYRDLAHNNLIRLIRDEEIGGGYAAVFQWADGECMGRMYPVSRKKFMSMPVETKMRVFEDILSFHSFVHEKGYVAIDFYDGSIMYDFEQGKTMICDIDFYAKKPYINNMGRLWGSSRFMSPEEFILGAEIDEITNVYTMGAVAFALFSEYDRSLGQWPLGKELYEVVKKAVSNKRELRQQSIQQLMDQWNCAKEGNEYGSAYDGTFDCT